MREIRVWNVNAELGRRSSSLDRFGAGTCCLHPVWTTCWWVVDGNEMPDRRTTLEHIESETNPFVDLRDPPVSGRYCVRR